jgi:hypothetical protein
MVLLTIQHREDLPTHSGQLYVFFEFGIGIRAWSRHDALMPGCGPEALLPFDEGPRDPSEPQKLLRRRVLSMHGRRSGSKAPLWEKGAAREDVRLARAGYS